MDYQYRVIKRQMTSPHRIIKLFVAGAFPIKHFNFIRPGIQVKIQGNYQHFNQEHRDCYNQPMTKNSFSCAACGGPNEPEAGTSHMACTYCGSKLTIPHAMRTKSESKDTQPTSQKITGTHVEINAPEILRRVRPVALGAWNLLAFWNLTKRILPACLVILLLGIVVCFALGFLPIFLVLTQ